MMLSLLGFTKKCFLVTWRMGEGVIEKSDVTMKALTLFQAGVGGPLWPRLTKISQPLPQG